jgi:hypothetical protein
MSTERISPDKAHEHLESDPDIMLVCASDENEKFEQNHNRKDHDHGYPAKPHDRSRA